MCKKRNILYMILTLGLCLIPSAGMLIFGPQRSAGSESGIQLPRLVSEEGNCNLRWLSQMGDYFERHFAFREQFITANALLLGSVFHVSADDGVIYGTDGWLYYMDSLQDYLGESLLDERELFCIAHSFRLLQEYAQKRGIAFLLALVPNKNTLYGEHMPYYYQYKVSGEKNLTRLYPWLDREEVAYVDLLETLGQSGDVLYHEKDSHWTNAGAALAGEAILDRLGREHAAYTEMPSESRRDFEGDLAEMLFPGRIPRDEEIYYDTIDIFAYVGDVKSNFDPKITTVNPSAAGNLIMYRDSFGNALLPFMANAFSNAYFSRSVPYPAVDLELYPVDTLVVERAERFLPDMCANPPVMAAPLCTELPGNARSIGKFTAVSENETAPVPNEKALPKIRLSSEGRYWKLEGKIDAGFLQCDTRVYVRVDRMLYEAFPIALREDGGTRADGYRLYLIKEDPQQMSTSAEIEVFAAP